MEPDFQPFLPPHALCFILKLLPFSAGTCPLIQATPPYRPLSLYLVSIDLYLPTLFLGLGRHLHQPPLFFSAPLNPSRDIIQDLQRRHWYSLVLSLPQWLTEQIFKFDIVALLHISNILFPIQSRGAKKPSQVLRYWVSTDLINISLHTRLHI